jgi:hypothetical protein
MIWLIPKKTIPSILSSRIKALASFCISGLLIVSCASQQTSTPTFVRSPETSTLARLVPNGKLTETLTPTLLLPIEDATQEVQNFINATMTARQTTLDAKWATQSAILPSCGYWGPETYSPDGNWIAFECLEPGIGVYNRKDTSIAWYFSYYKTFGLKYDNGNHFGKLIPKHWSNDRKYLYFAPFVGGDGGCPIYNEGQALFRLDLSSGKYTYILAPVENLSYYNFSFSNGDTYLGYFETWREQQVLKLANLISSQEFEIPLDKNYSGAGFLIWSQDNTQVFFSARTGEECENMKYDVITMSVNNHDQKTILSNNPIGYRPVQWIDENNIIVSAGITGSGYSENYYDLNILTGKLSPYIQITPTATP